MVRGWRTPRRRRIGGFACAPTRRSRDRHAVGQDRSAAAPSCRTTARWASVDRQPRGPRRHPVGVEDRSPVARLARGIPQPLDVLAPPEPVAGAGCLAADLAEVSERARCARSAGLGGRLHRRDLRPREKGGCDIGKTKRGKGSKLMVVVERQGLPLGVLVTSASPAETTLVHATLSTIAVPRSGPGRPRQKPPRLIADRG